MEDDIHTPAANTCQRIPELLKPGETPTNNPVEMHQDLEGMETRQACLLKMYSFLYLHFGEREGWIREWIKE